MHLLLANPNTSHAITNRIAATARAATTPGTEITAITAKTGVPYIASRADAVLGAAAVLEICAAHASTADAVVIAGFAEPGLGAAREMLEIPVVGLAEAAMLTACMLGRRFAIVSFTATLEAWLEETVAYHGLAGRCAGVFCLDEGFADIATVAEEKAAALVSLCARAVAAGADICILGGAPLAGLAAVVASEVPVPLIDGVAAAVRQAETLVALRPRKAMAGTFRRPPGKAVIGYSDPLRRWFAGG